MRATLKTVMLQLWSLLLTVVLTWVRSDIVQLNSRAALFQEVKSIHHNELLRHVVIHLAPNKRCEQPTFMARISGRSLYLLDQVHSSQASESFLASQMITFRYPPLVDVGTYFLEVVAMYCETLNPNDIAHMCLVHPQAGKNVMTLPYSFNISSAVRAAQQRPRWLLPAHITPSLLPTRHQEMCGDSYCVSKEVDLAQYNQYEWTDKPVYEHMINLTYEWGMSNMSNIPTHTRTGNESISICMVGASHALSLARHGVGLSLSHVSFRHIFSQYPAQFDMLDLANCTYAVVGYGQWPLSAWMQGQPYTGIKYEAEMRKVLETIRTYKPRTQVFMRSMNLNGLGVMYTSCPAQELRHPPLVMMYNGILSRLSAEYRVPFIDTFHIQGPQWDGSLDWSHPSDKVATAEVEHIVHSVLSYSHKNQIVPILDTIVAPPLNRRPQHGNVKFSNDSITVYVLKRGEVRPYPNKQTMDRVGVEWGVTTEIDAKYMANYKFGPVLPEV